MEFGLKKYRKIDLFDVMSFFWPGLFLIFWPAMQYGDGVPWTERGEGPFANLLPKWMKKLVPFKIIKSKAAIMLYAAWANVNGPSEKFGEKEAEWFQKLR